MVRLQEKIGSRAGNFPDTLDPLDAFGSAVCDLGDLDGDGTRELAIGAPGVDRGGAVFLFSVRADGSLARQREIGPDTGDVPDPGNDVGEFGAAVATLPDPDAELVPPFSLRHRPPFEFVK